MNATDERQALSQLAEESGWERRESDRIDVYVRDHARVRVLWRGPSAISGGSLYQDDVLMTHTRDLATVKGWFARR
jgi:hypothetical protein